MFISHVLYTIMTT